MADVWLPRSLAGLFPGSPQRLTLAAGTVEDLVRALDRQWPGMWDRLCTAGPAVREHINIFVDGEKANLRTLLRPEAIVRIIPAISGG